MTFYRKAITNARAKGWTYAKRDAAVFGTKKSYPVKKYNNTYKKATTRKTYVGYSRDEEKKYNDKTYSYWNWTKTAIGYFNGSVTIQQGLKLLCIPNNVAGSNANINLVSGMATGSTAVSRVGNKVNGKYIKVGLTIEAAKVPEIQYGEQTTTEVQETPIASYCKTTFRCVLVRDNQVNNNTNTIQWEDVFGNNAAGTDNVDFANSDNLDIKNMGRFWILKDFTCTVDADDPMKVLNFTQYINNEIRYNSDASNALTDVGYYLMIGQDTLGTANSLGSRLIPGNARATIRFCFTDA